MIITQILGFLFLYFIPGFLLVNLLFNKKDIISKLILSIGFSILINIVFGYVLGSMNLLKYDLLLIINIFFSVIIFLVIKLKDIKFNFKFKKSDLKTIIILVLISTFIFFLIFKVHHSYNGIYQDPYTANPYKEAVDMKINLPIHADEWTHLSQVVYIMDSQSLGFTNPYIKNFPFHLDLESGFHLFTAEHFILLKSDPVLSYKYLPALFAVITSLFIFLFMRKITNENIAFLSMLFFATLKSNINILGTWFFIPLSFSFFIIFLFLYLFLEKKKNLSDNIILGIIVLLSVLIYPLATILLVGVVIINYFFNNKFLKKQWLPATIIAILLLIAIKYFLPMLFFSDNWTPSVFQFNILFLYGILNSLLALIGFFFVFRREFNWIVTIIPIATLTNLIIHDFSGISLFLPYQRSLYYLMLSLIPLSAIGFYELTKTIRFKNKNVTKVIIALVLILILAFSFNNYYDISKQNNIADKDSRNMVLMIPVDMNDYEMMEYLFYNYGSKNVVLANDLLSFGIYPISKNHVFAIQSSNLGSNNMRIYSEFLKQSCENRTEFLQYYEIKFIISKIELDCKNLLEIYNKGNYIYESKDEI